MKKGKKEKSKFQYSLKNLITFVLYTSSPKKRNFTCINLILNRFVRCFTLFYIYNMYISLME